MVRKVDYSPERDIPKAVDELKTLSPKALSEWVRDNRTETDAFGKRHQKDITPESITMWFKRHPDVQKTLEKDLENELIPQEDISESLFQNGTFEKLPCIDKWQIEMSGKGANQSSIEDSTRLLRKICLGQIPRTRAERNEGKDFEYIEGWGLKHPARLTIDDALKYLNELKKRGKPNRNHRLVLRSFLASKNVEGWNTKISGAMTESAGKYAHLYAPPEKMRQIFAWLKRMNLEAHDSCYFAFKTACRTNATLEATARDVNLEEQTIYVYEKASLHKEKRRQEKLLPKDLWELLQPRIQKGGKLFDISESELNGLLRACYQEIIPDLAKDIPMPFHFFRHQFAQHGLRATGWNYGLIASLGHWTVQVLEKYYGKMDRRTAFEQGKLFLPSL